MNIATRAADRVGAKFLKIFCDTNGYQGTDYYLFQRGNQFSFACISFGTCALCDWRLGLVDDWENKNPDTPYSEMPDEVFLPMENHLVASLDTWYTQEELLANTHMIFGTGYSEEGIEKEAIEYFKELSNGA